MRLRINIPNCNGSPGFEKAFHAYVSSVRSIVLAWLLVGLNGGPATAGSSSTRPWGRWAPPSMTPPARSPGVPHIRGSACTFLPHAFCLGRPAYWPSRCPHAAAAWDASIGTFPVISVWRRQCWGISGLLCLRNSNGHCKWPCCWRWTPPGVAGVHHWEYSAPPSSNALVSYHVWACCSPAAGARPGAVPSKGRPILQESKSRPHLADCRESPNLAA